MTPSQQNAVRRMGQDVCVVAGPGSGKTRVLVERFAWLVEEQKVDPSRILAITFTEKAAAEIKDRLRERFATKPEFREATERAWVATIDGFCARLLRENAIAAGLAPDFTVMDEAAAQRLARGSAEDGLEEIFHTHGEQLRRLIGSLDLSTQEDDRNPDLARGLLDVYEAMRVSGVRELPAPVLSDAWPRAMERAREALADRLATGASVPQLRAWAEAFLALPAEISPEHFRVLERISEVNLTRIGKSAREAANEIKKELVPLLEQQWIARWNADLLALLRWAVTRIDALYRERKARDGLLDFADLGEHAIRLLESDASVRKETAERFDEVVMEELQDTNRLQWKLINLVRRRFFAVGDINQSIYGFRHAEPVVFEEFREGLIDAGHQVDDLRENHRSSKEILDAVSRMLDGQPGIEARPLISVRGSGVAVERLVGRGQNGDEVEASLVASRIRELVMGGREFQDIAILVRTMSAAAPFERALDRLGIQFLVTGGRTFLEAREFRDLMSLLAALANPLDDIALIGVLRSPFAGIGDEEILRMGREGWLAEFDQRFGRLRARAGFNAPDLLLAMAVDETGYAIGLPERAQANIDKFLGLLRRDYRHRPLAEVLEEMESLRAMQAEAEAPPDDAGDVVQVMSIHAAKGLEFPVVFVSALHRVPDRRNPVIAFSAAAGLGAKWRNPATGKGASDTAHARIVEEIKRKEEAEENRLLYVAMTRAEDRLILSHAERARGSSWTKLAEAAIPVTRAADRVEETPAGIATETDKIRAELAERPVVTGQYDSTAAATAISVFQTCPRKYLLNSTAGRRTEGTGAMAIGVEVHRILAGGTGSGSGEASELEARIPTSELRRRAARAVRVEREFDFMVPVEDMVVRGQIDLWFEEGGELILVDYKTDRDDSSGEAYAVQLGLYAIAVQCYAGRIPDRAVLYYLRSDKTVEVKIDTEAAVAAVRTLMEAQERREFPLRVGAQCRRCVFFGNRCPAQLSASGGF